MLPPYLPPMIVATLVPFAPLFSRRVWAHVQVLVAGASRAQARRTAAAICASWGWPSTSAAPARRFWSVRPGRG